MIEEIPTVGQLLKSVATLLSNEISPALAQQDLQFKVRIAVNVLAIIEREWQQGPQVAEEEVAMVNALLGTDNHDLKALRAELAEAIMNGQYDDDLSALATRLLPNACSRLSIDNPLYSTLLELQK
ncbi:DUF6285 domain-containing protein [Halioxenophilus sp. WMMB6]|uniref:DUF6285 domain-containing protein n=1 Tax=Halioxenophilus sp. WMMB6 TaxID=3073815 RepID=UPI00295EA26A|nr:DUF6285 domain-containing protein [Halioxenophilus sp. WMMB6]